MHDHFTVYYFVRLPCTFLHLPTPCARGNDLTLRYTVRVSFQCSPTKIRQILRATQPFIKRLMFHFCQPVWRIVSVVCIH